MSIKIFEGYRIPLYRLTEAIKFIHDVQYNTAYDSICKLINESPLKEKSNDDIDKFFEEIHKKTDSIYNSMFNYKRGFNVYIDDEIQEKVGLFPQFTYAYIIPWGYSISDQTPDWFEDFHYQNQVDSPEDVSSEDYEARYNTLVKIGSFRNNTVLTHTSVDAGTIFDFERRWFRENK